jgi:ATP-dependent RNA helicase DeaD
MENFDAFSLNPSISRALKEMGFLAPSPIQEQTLPKLLGKSTDFLGMAATGTGKTAAFGIPLLAQIDVERRDLQGIVLCPTRELALQVAEQLTQLGRYLPVRALAVYGGEGFLEQTRALRRGCFLLVATPGRLLDHLTRGHIDVSQVKTVVLDEADEMISMGFQDELEAILKALPKKNVHFWLFAATMRGQLSKMASRYLREPETVQLNNKERLPGTVKQVQINVRERNKPKALLALLETADDFYGLIFCATRQLTDDVTDFLKSHGHKAAALHGEKTQTERNGIVARLKSKEVTIVVCTDVAARGLHISDLTHIINYTLPSDPEAYVHRIGRTGRHGKTGIAISLVDLSQRQLVKKICHFTKTALEETIIPSAHAIREKQLARLFKKFEEVPETPILPLSEEWKARAKNLPAEQIISRFLSLLIPQPLKEIPAEKYPEKKYTAPRDRGQRRRH